MRLGRRQRDVLAAAAAGKAYAWHSGQGRMAVAGVEDVYGDEVLERLLDLDLVAPGETRGVNGYDLVLTDAGREALDG